MEKNSRLLCLLQVLQRETDDEHMLTTSQLIAKLAELDISSHRETITSDIKLLQNAGYDIICNKSTQNKYFLASREFEPVELKMLADAVNAAQFISAEKSKQLIGKLFSSVSKYQEEQLKCSVSASSCNKAESSISMYSADLINTAVAQGVKIKFQYYEYTAKKEKVLKHNGFTYKVSPYATVWNDDRYYLVGYCEKHEDITVFRIDRITNIKLTKNVSKPCPENFCLKDFLSQSFKMFHGELTEVNLKCHSKHMKAIIDKFGDDVQTEIIDKNYFSTKVNVELSPTFYSWIFQFKGEIGIQSPQKAIDEFVQMIESVIQVSE